ncbi:MAG: hypothetical protein LBG78_09650 [Azoarcus sp.]|jgi:hypothetical protein|nr:hypothetical protein [Azoarcus sp.]
MNARKSHVVLAAMLVAAACFSTPASARNGHIRDALLAPLLLPPAIVAATISAPVVVYDDYDYYDAPRYRRGPPPRRHMHRAPPPRRDYRRHDGGHYRHR